MSRMPLSSPHVTQMGVKRVKRNVAVVELVGAPLCIEPGDGRGFQIEKTVVLSDMENDSTAISKFYGAVAAEPVEGDAGFEHLVSLVTSLVTKQVTEELADTRCREGGVGNDILGKFIRSDYTYILVRRMFDNWSESLEGKVILKKASKLLRKLYAERGFVQGSSDFLHETKEQLRRSNRGTKDKHLKATLAPDARLELVKQAAELAFANNLRGEGFVDIVDVYLKANAAVHNVVSLDELDAVEASAHLVAKKASLPWVSYFVSELKQHL